MGFKTALEKVRPYFHGTEAKKSEASVEVFDVQGQVRSFDYSPEQAHDVDVHSFGVTVGGKMSLTFQEAREELSTSQWKDAYAQAVEFLVSQYDWDRSKFYSERTYDNHQ